MPINKKAQMIRKLTILFLSFFLVACGSLPDNSFQLESTAVSPVVGETLANEILQEHNGTTENSRFAILGSGLDAFTARAVLAGQAQHSIDAQYYILSDDLTGNLFLGLLAQAADRGVRVRLLVDDFFVDARDTRLIAMASLENVEVRIFNPFARGGPRLGQYVTRFDEVSRRMHNKSFIVDNQVMIVGGRNIGDEYFSANSHHEYFDMDIINRGPIVRQQSLSFDRYWNSDLSYSISSLNRRAPSPEEMSLARAQIFQSPERNNDSVYANALRDSDFANALRDGSLLVHEGEARVVADLPDKISNERNRSDLRMTSEISAEFERAREEVTIITPYFVPGRVGVEHFRNLVEAGVRVRILTNSLATNNQRLVHAHYGAFRAALVQAGVELYELRGDATYDEARNTPTTDENRVGRPTLHTKMFIIDRERIFFGSLNFDPRSFVENTEQGVVYASPDMSDTIASWLDHQVSEIAWRVLLDDRENLVWETTRDGERQRVLTEPDSHLWRRFQDRLIRLLPIRPLL